jgi:hypothetical protein
MKRVFGGAGRIKGVAHEGAQLAVLLFLEVSGLTHGVFGFAESRGGETIFFECNPAGQWSIPAQACNMDISGLIADQILKGTV